MSYRDYSGPNDSLRGRRPELYIGALALLVAVLALRLFQIQVVGYSLYLNKEEDYRIKREVIEAPRGFIYDRNGEILATNRISYSVTVDPFERDNFSTTIPRLAALVPDIDRIMGFPGEELLDSVRVFTRVSQNPAVLIQDADFTTISVIEEHSLELPGIGCIIGQQRHYPHGALASHIIGYMGKLTRNEAEALTGKGYDKNQWIGRNGIEKYYEKTLKGVNGARFLEKNYLNRFMGPLPELSPTPASPGQDVVLTIDYRLQQVAEAAFGDSLLGAFVALDPRNGEILALVSMPGFDPNEFATTMSGGRYTELQTDPDKPMYNRAIQGLYPPGSTFKMLTALAGLESGVTPETRFRSCGGYFVYGGREYDCWNRNTGGHGSLGMIEAIEQSCNVYFYQLGLRVGIDQWSKICGLLGFGVRTGIDLGGEEPGNQPGMAFYNKRGMTYSTGMVLNLAIGQGENSVTPLQLAHYAGILATSGLDAQPHLIRGSAPSPTRVPGISTESFAVVREGMLNVVNGSHGTARSAAVPGHLIAAKTGTAQNPHGDAHKVFVAFAPYDNPTIAIACIAENAEAISPTPAVAISRKVLEEYFKHYPDLTQPKMVAANDEAL